MHLCQQDWASTFRPVLLSLICNIWAYMLTNACTHTYTNTHNFCFFSLLKKMIDDYGFWCIDCMLLWNYIFGAGWVLEGRQIGLTKWEWAQSGVSWIGSLGNGAPKGSEWFQHWHHRLTSILPLLLHVITLERRIAVPKWREIFETESTPLFILQYMLHSPTWWHCCTNGKAAVQLSVFLLLQ